MVPSFTNYLASFVTPTKLIDKHTVVFNESNAVINIVQKLAYQGEIFLKIMLSHDRSLRGRFEF